MAGKETYNSLSHRVLTMTKIIIVNRHLFRGGYYAITLFGVVFARRELTAKEINHERIHAAQQRELLYLPFFVWYLVEWLFYLAKFRRWTTAYYHVRFEREAYEHESDLHYLESRHHYNFLRS